MNSYINPFSIEHSNFKMEYSDKNFSEELELLSNNLNTILLFLS